MAHPMRGDEHRQVKPMYVMQMGFSRWGDDARRRWLLELREACLTVIRRIDGMGLTR